MEVWHQKNLFNSNSNYPLNIILVDMNEFPLHWHEAIEVIYVIGDELSVGVGSEIFNLKSRDVLFIGSGEPHYFLNMPNPCKRIVIQFELPLFESFADIVKDRRFKNPLIDFKGEINNPGNCLIHQKIEQQILQLIKEYRNKEEGYKIALKARIYDMLVLILREVPMEEYPIIEKNKHLKNLERLEQVFKFVENNYAKDITLAMVANESNFSIYHFSRFFKNTTGMTFFQYLNNYRIIKASELLLNNRDSITEICYKCGFNSIKTFNRIFKKTKGCSPTQYIKMRCK